MSLAGLYNIPNDPRSLSQFAFENRMSHVVIAQRLFQLTGFNLALPVLDPIPEFDMRTWAIAHQILHNAQNGALGIAGNDLTDVDWSKPAQVADWIQLHAKEHYQASQALGVA